MRLKLLGVGLFDSVSTDYSPAWSLAGCVYNDLN